MSLRNRFVLPIVFSALAVLAGCGGGSNKATPPPSGSFSNSDLSGTYAFSALGVDAGGAPFALGGDLVANGTGGITGGALDLNDASLPSPFPGLTITGGKYSVTADGRGQATLNTSQGSVTLDFVLMSSSHALITRYDGNGTGSGSMDLSSVATQAQLAGSYAFSLAGIDSAGAPLATVGSFTLDASGNVTSGVEDFNDQGFAYLALTLSGTVTLGSGNAPGTATLTAVTSTNSSPFGTTTFDVYAVDATHLKFVEKDVAPILTGDVFTQQGASLPSSASVLAFTMGGGVSAPVAVGGLMSIDGAGTVTTGSLDINDNGTTSTTPLTFSGTYAASGSVGGRTLFNLTNFPVATQFVAYPTTSGGTQMLESDSLGLLGGTAYLQTSTAFSPSDGYGMNLTAINIGGLTGFFEEDDIAEFTTTSTGFSGLTDINDEGSLSFNQRLSGTYTLDTPATGRGIFLSNAFNGAFYAIDGSHVLFVEMDSNQIGTGSMELQTPGAQSKVAASRMTVLHLQPAARANFRRRQK